MQCPLDCLVMPLCAASKQSCCLLQQMGTKSPPLMQARDSACQVRESEVHNAPEPGTRSLTFLTKHKLRGSDVPALPAAQIAVVRPAPPPGALPALMPPSKVIIFQQFGFLTTANMSCLPFPVQQLQCVDCISGPLYLLVGGTFSTGRVLPFGDIFLPAMSIMISASSFSGVLLVP